MCLLVTTLLAAPLAAQLQWTLLTPANAPSPRSLVSAVDAGPLGVILFGGELSYSGSSYVNDTWQWANGNWTQLQPGGGWMVPRGGGAMCYDPARDRVVYFGGWPGNGYLDDTWEFDGTDWNNVTPAVSPAGRDWAGMAFDPFTQKVLMFGGHDWTMPAPYGDTWSWDGSTWTQLAPATTPAPRLGHVMTTCDEWGFLVMHGGMVQIGPVSTPNVYGTDSWLWIGNDWALMNPASGVPGRAFAAAAWDPRRERLVVTGGLDDTQVFSDVWELDSGGWNQRSPSGNGQGAQNAAAFFDGERGEVVVFGGATGLVNRTPVSNATWALGPTDPAIAQAFGTGCGNAPSLEASHLAWLGMTYQTQCSGALGNSAVLFLVGLSRTLAGGTIPLPLSLASYGMPGCQLLVDPVISALAFTGPTGAAALSFNLPASPAFLGTWIYSQVAMPSAGANPAGIVLSHAVEHRLGGI